jgi:hypothetical protein
VRIDAVDHADLGRLLQHLDGKAAPHRGQCCGQAPNAAGSNEDGQVVWFVAHFLSPEMVESLKVARLMAISNTHSKYTDD